MQMFKKIACCLLLLLAYELFYGNRDSKGSAPKKQLPVKMIFYKDNTATVDEKTLEEWGSETTKGTKELQNWLKMPLNTSDDVISKLPDHRVGAAAPNPYLEIYGIIKTNKASETKLEITIGKKPDYIKHILDVSAGEVIKEADGKPKLRIDKKNYWVNSSTLFSEYVDSGIIDDEGILNVSAYDGIVEKFMEFAKKQEHSITKPSKIPFRIYVLPDDHIIKFKRADESKGDPEQDPFTDYLGMKAFRHASSATKTAKFLSYDDRAFTINCKQKEEFYKNIGVGDSSLDKIYTDPKQTFTISRLDWTFTNITTDSEHKREFTDTGKGILVQLYQNYITLKGNSGLTENAQLKVICIRINQAKQEVMIDENLTTDRMEKMFSDMKDIPPLCIEVLIDNSGKNPIWDTYLYAVKNFLMNNNTPKDYLLSFFNKSVRQEIHKWIKSKNQHDQVSFFKRSSYCLQHLCNRGKDTYSYMDKNEEFAEKIGQIAKAYIDFKQNIGEMDNSLSDILTYSKYDRERLRFIVARIGKGVQLSKTSDEKKKNATDKIRSLQPDKEITDDAASKDYSYFFFKGYYSKMEMMV